MNIVGATIYWQFSKMSSPVFNFPQQFNSCFEKCEIFLKSAHIFAA